MSKSYNDIKADMSAIFDEVRSGSCDLKIAGELSNIAGKILKAYQLELATAHFVSSAPENKALLTDETRD